MSKRRSEDKYNLQFQQPEEGNPAENVENELEAPTPAAQLSPVYPVSATKTNPNFLRRDNKAAA